MLSLSPRTRVFAALGATDMGKSYDTLAEAVRRVIGEDPLSGDVFVFCNRGRNRIKHLCFDRGGFWLVARRLERGTFAWPRESVEGRVTMRADDLLLLLGGLDPSSFKRRVWYERAG
ncbi:MAG: IS66 family insertion sequence element accessory protein TnpB [Planctomycetes bacterium]|nr:IS66 family insertion sequence element accessory protein TnpB [Planctomycetota bacterium]